ncbi:CBM35 domain-containing protein [Clostridium sp. C8-1-8]|uniref:CBM35 domain-containing protein n=1 Tax=Clostridium sp. C8-1-8 TaxID=2698831 RepID=UPI00136C052E|nr:CBM35 domain-containing protein [Clostridium sp. C8-1-8]
MMRKFMSKKAAGTFAFILAASMFSNVSLKASAQTYPQSTYEAESASLHNVSVDANHAGYSGSGFIDGFAEVGDYVDFNISVATTQDYTLRLKYSNFTGATNVREVYVDGKFISNAYCSDTGSWDSWKTTDVGTNLTAGTHTVRVSLNNSKDGAINLDNLVVTQKNVSVRSLYMSNWKDTMAIWQASKLSDNDTTSAKGPRLSELRYSGNWNVNQIQDYTGFFRDETNNAKYDQTHNFDSEGYYDENGVLHNNFLKYNGSNLPNMEISKDYVAVPNQNFIVSRYTLKNTGTSSITYSILDMLHPNNTTSNNVAANYDSSRNALIVNMSASGQPYMALGAFTAPTYYQAANDGDSNTSSSTCSSWYTFDGSGSLKNNSNVSAQNVSVAFDQKVTVPAGSSQNVYFYVALGSSLSNVQSICDTARAQSGDSWFNNTSSSYSSWFNGKTVPSFNDADLTSVYKRNLVMIKNAIRPGSTSADGAMPATTNPLNYSYKIWARDSAVTAMSLDAAGFTTEGERYWNWLAARQSTDGSFHTCFWLWDNTNANFVEPENDSIGFFLIGAYKHYKATGNKAFLDGVYKAVKNSASYIMTNMDQTTGFGPADKSIWEEGDSPQYYAYTQASYAMGLKSAALIATLEGDNALADSYNGAGSTILTAINRDDTAYPKGLWNAANGYYDRCINTDGTVNTLEDTSTNILFALGAIDVNSSRATSHVNKIEKDLNADTYGLPRYANDTFYYTSQWSPSGNEALEASPSWPQMTMWDSVYQTYKGNGSKSYDMLEWFKHRTGAGFMVTGEAVSNVTEAPLVSTAAEPVTAASFILASLAYSNNYDMRVYSSENNAGCYKGITVTNGASADWNQYKYVPYYVDPSNDGVVADGQTDIKKVYISNDDSNVYIRINNAAGTLPTTTDNSFQVSAYVEDFAKTAPTTTSTQYGTALGRNMAYMFTRKNTDAGYSKYSVSNGSWTLNKSITSVIAPQWDTTTGGIELVIPRSEIGSPANGSWGHITVDLSKYVNSNWQDQDTLRLNYKITGSSDSWLYGNFE